MVAAVQTFVFQFGADTAVGDFHQDFDNDESNDEEVYAGDQRAEELRAEKGETAAVDKTRGAAGKGRIGKDANEKDPQKTAHAVERPYIHGVVLAAGGTELYAAVA